MGRDQLTDIHVLRYNLHHEGVWGNRCISPLILYLRVRWRCILRPTLLPLYP